MDFVACWFSFFDCENLLLVALCIYYLLNASDVSEKYAQAQSEAALAVPPECLGGDVGRSLVAAAHPRHDAAGVPDLQGLHGVLRRHRDKHSGGSSAQVGCLWNHHLGTRPVGRAEGDLLANRERNRSGAGSYGDGSLGSRARRHRQPSARPVDASGQGEVSRRSAGALGEPAFIPGLDSLLLSETSVSAYHRSGHWSALRSAPSDIKSLPTRLRRCS